MRQPISLVPLPSVTPSLPSSSPPFLLDFLLLLLPPSPSFSLLLLARAKWDQELSIPGFFGTGLAWNFYPGILPKKYGYGQISQIMCLQMENFVVAILC